MHTISVHSKTFICGPTAAGHIHRQHVPHWDCASPITGKLRYWITVDPAVMTFAGLHAGLSAESGSCSGTVEATDEFDAGPKLAAVIVDSSPVSCSSRAKSWTDDRNIGANGAAFVNQEAIRRNSSLCSIDICESHTMWMKAICSGRA